MSTVANVEPRRQYRHVGTRTQAWVDQRTGAAVDTRGGDAKVPKGGGVAALIRSLDRLGRPGRVQLCGPLPAGGGRDGLRRFAYAAGVGRSRGLPEGWGHGRHWLPDSGSPVLRYTGPDGARLEVHWAGSWGWEDFTPRQCADTWGTLAGELDRRMKGAPLLGTPVATALYSMDRMIGCDRTVWDDDDQALIRQTSGQHRMEWLAVGRDLPQLVELDMHLAYGALCWGLGAGPARWYPGTGGFRYEAGARWDVRFTVPRTWDRPYGLLPVKADDGISWAWPATPGTSHEGWADGSEVAVAIAAGWDVHVYAGVGPADPKADPLRRWAEALTGLHHVADMVGEPMLADAARAVLVQGVGALVARPSVVQSAVPADQTHLIPASALPGSIRPVEAAGIVTWAEHAPTNRGDLAHPEWAAKIWGRCRARLLAGPVGTGVQALPPGIVCGFRGDALYLTDDPGWPYQAKPGQWRPKKVWPGPLNFAGLGDLDRHRRSTEAGS